MALTGPWPPRPEDETGGTVNEIYESRRSQPAFEPRRTEDMSEIELLERLFEMTCPSCDREMIRQAAEDVAENLD